MTKYRIVRDRFAGYEVQAWRWWFPFWMQVGVNTHSSVERAEYFAWCSAQKVVKNLGNFSLKPSPSSQGEEQ